MEDQIGLIIFLITMALFTVIKALAERAQKRRAEERKFQMGPPPASEPEAPAEEPVTPWEEAKRYLEELDRQQRPAAPPPPAVPEPQPRRAIEPAPATTLAPMEEGDEHKSIVISAPRELPMDLEKEVTEFTRTISEDVIERKIDLSKPRLEPAKPVAAASSARSSARSSRIASRLVVGDLRDSIVLTEILGPPCSLRDRDLIQ